MREVLNNRYRIVRLLGRGGMGKVYLVHDEVLSRDVAVKVLSRDLAEHEEFVERFEREAKSAASLSHPNIVAVHDRGLTEDGDHFIAMEYVPGGTLEDLVKTKGPLPPDRATAVALQVAAALGAAHARGVIHRDIKPQNVLISESGEAKVADFGIARALDSTTLTRTGFGMGTARYLSPEQAMGGPASPRSDLYSLGVVLYEMLTGRAPHDAETPIGVAMKHMNEVPLPPKDSNPSVPEALDSLTMSLLAKDPAGRPTSADALVEELERISRGVSVQPEVRDPGPTVPLRRSVHQDTTGSTRPYPPRPPTAPARAAPPRATTPRSGPTGGGRRRGPIALVAAWGLGALVMLGVLMLVGVGAVALGGLDSISNLVGGTDGAEGRPGARNEPPPTPSEAPKTTPYAQPAPEPDEDGEGEASLVAAVEDYYRAVDREDWSYTYARLDSETKALFTEEEWYLKNQWFADNEGLVLSTMDVVVNDSASDRAVGVTVYRTFENGVSINRDTFFVYEGGVWKHRFTPEESGFFMPGASFEDFVAAQQVGSPSASASPNASAPVGEEEAVEDAVRDHYEAIGEGDFEEAYYYFGPTTRSRQDEAGWVETEEAFQIKSSTIHSLAVDEVLGSTATATVDVSFEDDTGTPRFVIVWGLLREGGQWKLDEQISARRIE